MRPLLFIFMINDLVNYIKFSKIIFFADDFKIYREIQTVEDCQKLQSDLNSAFNWSLDNGFEFNIKKCAIISFYKNKFIECKYTLGGGDLVRVSTVRDLGIYIDSTLSFVDHIEYIINKAYKKLGFIQRYSKQFKDPYTYLHLYKTIVKPTLTYASEIWSPKPDYLQYEIEKVQHRFLRSFSHRIGSPMLFNNHDYTEMLLKTNLPTLKSSRCYQDLLFLYKVINSLIDSPELIENINWHVPARILRPTQTTFQREIESEELLYRNVLSRACRYINEKLNEVDLNFLSLNECKRILRRSVLFAIE